MIFIAMCIGFVAGVISMVGAIYITERENRKKKLLKKSKTRFYHYDFNKKEPLSDGSQKRRG